jgi:hypothetical protein
MKCLLTKLTLFIVVPISEWHHKFFVILIRVRRLWVVDNHWPTKSIDVLPIGVLSRCNKYHVPKVIQTRVRYLLRATNKFLDLEFGIRKWIVPLVESGRRQHRVDHPFGLCFAVWSRDSEYSWSRYRVDYSRLQIPKEFSVYSRRSCWKGSYSVANRRTNRRTRPSAKSLAICMCI